MNSKNVKSSIIILLILANFFFIWNLYYLTDKTSNISDKMVKDTVKLINANKNIISENIIPRRKPTAYIYEGTFYRTEFESVTKKISGTLISKTFPLPNDGMSYVSGDYKFDFGSFGVEDDIFAINIYESEYFGDRGIDIGSYINQKTEQSGSMAELTKKELRADIAIIKEFLKVEKETGRMDFAVLSAGSEGSSHYLVIVQSVDKIQIESNKIFVMVEDGKVRCFCGDWYFGALGERRTMPLLDSVNILFKSSEKDSAMYDGSEKITGIAEKYGIIWHEEDKFYIVPSWLVIFESGKNYIYNMITGDKI